MTSLSEQLKKLAVPQTSALADLKKRPSILFDLKEAATKDRSTIYDLGCQGLSELISLNHKFSIFQETLFQHTSLNLERSVEDSAFNKQLDLNIKKFFHHLSPYFMLRSSHLCLEWLIRRFNVHEYNKDDFVALILPYHETNIFVKCLQILRIKDESDPWHWLQPLQKPGMPLPKSAIFNRAASEPSFLQFICKSVMDATKELDRVSKAHTLQCLINFYCSVVIGAFENCNQIKEWHVSTVIESIVRGMKSRVPDIVSASFMITTQLVNKTNLTLKVLNVLVGHIWKVNLDALQSTSILLLNWIAKTHADVLTQFPEKGFVEFIEQAWLNNKISNLSKDGISMLYLAIPLINTAFHILQTDVDNAEACRRYVESLLFEVHFSSHAAKIVIKCVLEALSSKAQKKELKEGDVIDLESDCEMPSQDNVIKWFIKIIQILERQYPSEMDVVIKEAMETGSGKTSKNGIKIALAYRYKFLNEDTSSIFQNLYHINPKIRAFSVKEIIKQITKNQNDLQHYSMLKEALADRINDDNEKVVQEILKLPTTVCIEMIGIKLFVENIIKILDKATTNPHCWRNLQIPALTHLTSDVVLKDYDSNIILLAVSRYLIPIKNDLENVKYIGFILQSPLVEKKPFLLTLVKKYKDTKINLDEFKKDFLDILSLSDDTPHAEDLVESMNKNGDEIFKTSIQMSHFLIMVTVCFKTKNDLDKATKIYEYTINQCSHFRIAHSNSDRKVLNSVPLNLFTDFLNSLILGTDFESLQDWNSCSKSLKLFLNIFSLLTFKAFTAKADTNEKQEWTKSLRDLLYLLLPTTKLKLNFLSQFLIHEHLNCIDNFTETRIRAVRLLEIILRGGKIDKSDIDLRFILKTIVALNSPLPTIRECALDILRAVKSFTNEDISNLIRNIIERSEEIHFDAEQISLILFTILNSKRKSSANALVGNILNIVDDPAEGIYFKSKVVEILKHIQSASILNAMIPAALLALENVQTVGNIQILDEPTASIFKSVVIRFDENCIQEVVATNKKAWHLIEKAFKLSKVFLNHDGKLTPVPCIILQILDEGTYDKLPIANKIALLKLIVETISLSDNDALFLDVNKALKKCNIDCKHILPLLESMSSNLNENASSQKKRRPVARLAAIDSGLLNSKQWKEGIVLLELLENKKKLQNTQVLIPVLFDTLRRCLDMENQSPTEYTKQLILSALLQCCQKSKAENLLCEISESTFRIDLIVQCIRVTQNPQTHYNALLFLSHCAMLFPQQVLHNLVDIFTFMGSSIARHDDAFSFQIISNIVESIIPILVNDNNSVAAGNKRVVAVLKIFSDILLDVPEHRRTPLYTKLLTTLGPEKYFWLFLCVVFESHVIHDDKNKLSVSNNESAGGAGEKLPKRIELVLNLLNEFSTSVSIQTCTALLAYVKRLPMNKEEETDSGISLDSQDSDLFNAKTRSSKQLRHYKYLILQFVSTFTSSVNFLSAISVLNEDQNIQNKSLYKNLIIKTLSYIPDVTAAIEKSTEPTQLKFWKVIQHHCYDALDNVISLLSPDIFLIAVHGLLQHQLMTIRKKVIELLISKLQQKIDYFEDCSEENVLNLLSSLCDLIGAITTKDHKDSRSATKTTSTTETILVQQAGLIAIKLLSRQFALKYKTQFKNIVDHLTTVTKKRIRLPKVVLATVILTLVEVMSNLKAHGIAHLPKFMPHLIDALNDQTSILENQSPDNVCLALMTGIQKLFESMPLFLGPYIVGIVSELSKMWSLIKNREVEHDQKRIVNINKLETIWKKIAKEVPARILIPNCENAYYGLMNDGNFASISFVMKLFFECVSNASDSDLSAVQVELTNFFLKCLEFRSQIGSSSSNSTSIEDISSIEMEIINAFVAWILKLSESSFRPVYKKVYDWGFEANGPKERVLTYFILNRSISNSLKSLFVLFSADFIKDASELMTACNASKNTELYFENSDALNVELLKNILYTLTNIFVYDSKGFANAHRFNILMQPIVDQLENKLILENEELQGILLLCIAQLAVAVSNDVLWKELHYQILLKTRSNMPEVRIISFNCCVELARKLGDDFTSLLPETVPFIAELFEDENALVVKNSRRAVQELESILGESLQKYL